MKIKTLELTDAALDWAVAWAENITIKHFSGVFYLLDGDEWNPTRNWAQGGPIIERQEIAIFLEYPKSWCATNGDVRSPGDTPLMAAMRCYVKSKYGEEIDTKRKLAA